MNKYSQNKQGSSGEGAIYGLGMVGAAIYFIQHANSFFDGVLGIIKAIFWPALLIYKAMGMLNI